MKPRTKLRHQSKKREGEARLYAKRKKVFLEETRFCVKCSDFIEPRYRTLHHFYGRTGALLYWVPGFRMCCLPCHQFIETHRNDAVKLGLRAPDNLFGRPSKVIGDGDPGF